RGWRAAQPARGRSRGDGPQSPEGLSRPDGAARRVLRRARHPPPLRRDAQPDGGPRPPPGDDRHAPHGGRALTGRESGPESGPPAPARPLWRAVITRKTPDEIDKMAAAGAILVRTLKLLEGKVRE